MGEENKKKKTKEKLETIIEDKQETLAEKPCTIIKILSENRNINGESLALRRKIEDELTPIIINARHKMW